MVGLPGFEPGSIAPKATSIDQTNPQAPSNGCGWRIVMNFARAMTTFQGHFWLEFPLFRPVQSGDAIWFHKYPSWRELLLKWLDGQYSCVICGISHSLNTSRVIITSITGHIYGIFFVLYLDSFVNVFGNFPWHICIRNCRGKLTWIAINGDCFGVWGAAFSTRWRGIGPTAEWMSANASTQLPLITHIIRQ